MSSNSFKVRTFEEIKGMREVSDDLARGIYDLLSTAEKAKRPATLTIAFRCEVTATSGHIELLRDMMIEVEK